ncbi:MAG TPA: hypothetical protein VFD21_15010 [Vicinamibacterales bacterium]|nr:hypothetical protein [Vicinamibacterales bacterium]
MRVWPSRSGIAVFVAIGLLASSAVVAQYVKYPTANVPRTADGKPNLKAPTPRTADGKPDFSGMWFTDDAVPCARSGGAAFFECGIELPLSQYGVNYGYAIPGGLPYQPWAAELVKKRMAENAKDDPHVRCMPDTFLRSYGLPHYQKWIQVPGLLVQLDEMNAMYRQIFTDGRPLPTDPNPAWNGYSTAKWDKDTLVIDSSGFRDDLWIDISGSVISEAAKVRERIRRPDYGHLQIEVTVDDPKVYTKPWTVTLKERIVLDTELIDEICLENEKSYERINKAK